MRRPEDNAFSGEESLAPVNLTVPSEGDARSGVSASIGIESRQYEASIQPGPDQCASPAAPGVGMVERTSHRGTYILPGERKLLLLFPCLL